MIPYKYPYEKEFLLYYAKTLKNIKVEEILKKDCIQCEEDARALAGFFWRLVDQTVIDTKTNLAIAGCNNLESCCEDIMQTLRSHFFGNRIYRDLGRCIRQSLNTIKTTWYCAFRA